ncbi:MAG: hypothetical protein ABSG46_11260 [Candidatus Binataceae bacterium]|jgi:hypothetical protein
MKFHLNGSPLHRLAKRLAHAAGRYADGSRSNEARASRRCNAIRNAIASLVETERMRLALTLGHRNDR